MARFIKCLKCGNKINENVKFCPECGTENKKIEITKDRYITLYDALKYPDEQAKILLILGVLLTITGFGAIIGIPMIMVAVLILFKFKNKIGRMKLE